MMRLVKYLKQNTTLVWTRMNRMLCPTKTLFKSLHTVLGCLTGALPPHKDHIEFRHLYIV